MPALLPFRAFTYSPEAGHLEELIHIPGEDAPRNVQVSLLVQDAIPALYLYRQTFGDSVREGVIGLLDRAESGPIYRHEETDAVKVAECLVDIREGRTEPGSLWLWVNDVDGSLSSLLSALLNTQGSPDNSAKDRTGTLHEIWRIADPVDITAIQTALDGKELFLADGHHRFAAGWNLATIQIRTDALRTVHQPGASLDDLEANARRGILLPLKSTDFRPKLAAGLVMYRHQNEAVSPPIAHLPGVR